MAHHTIKVAVQNDSLLRTLFGHVRWSKHFASKSKIRRDSEDTPHRGCGKADLADEQGKRNCSEGEDLRHAKARFNHECSLIKDYQQLIPARILGSGASSLRRDLTDP